MHHRAKKSLGQNFLKSKKALLEIVESAHISPSDTILEIGPGKGALTEQLLEKEGRVIAIEKDRDLIILLKEKFSKEIESKKLELIEGDILDFDLEALYTKSNNSYKVIANIPYYITGALIRLFLEARIQPKTMVLLLQKEVVDRIVARDKKESILSIAVKAYGTPVYISKVSKKYFSPIPNVDSGIIAIKDISKNTFKDIKEEFFFSVVKTGFAHKRKFLAQNLTLLDIPKEIILKALVASAISEKARAENLSIQNWIMLIKNISTLLAQ